jgi:hypothetical protein
MKDSNQGTTDQWCAPYSEQENLPRKIGSSETKPPDRTSDLETAQEVTQNQ